jgi:hypothetical protein
MGTLFFSSLLQFLFCSSFIAAAMKIDGWARHGQSGGVDLLQRLREARRTG